MCMGSRGQSIEKCAPARPNLIGNALPKAYRNRDKAVRFRVDSCAIQERFDAGCSDSWLLQERKHWKVMRFRCPHLPLYNIKRGDKGKAAPAHSYAKQTAFYIKQGPRRSSRILPWLAKGTSVYSPRTLAALLSDTSRILSWPADQQDRRRSSHDGRSEVWRLSRVGLGRFCGGLSAVAIPTIAWASIYL